MDQSLIDRLFKRMFKQLKPANGDGPTHTLLRGATGTEPYINGLRYIILYMHPYHYDILEEYVLNPRRTTLIAEFG